MPLSFFRQSYNNNYIDRLIFQFSLVSVITFKKRGDFQMDFKTILPTESKMRIIQESVPGKQITLAHVIANADSTIYKKLGLNPDIDYSRAAIAIITMTPSETAIIAGDIALKTSSVELGFVDRFSGTLIITGGFSEIESAVMSILTYCRETLAFTVCDVTRT